MWFNERDDFILKECNYYEITSIYFNDKAITSDDKWLSMFQIDFNMSIEIWETILYIRANTVVVDDKVFSLCFK